MATHHVTEDRHSALKLYGVNHPEWGTHGLDIEIQFWKVARSLAGIPWGDDRATQINAAAAAFGITLPALSTANGPFQREQSFWAQWLALPPTAAP